MTRSVLKDVISPVCLFTILAGLAGFCIFGHFYLSGTPQAFDALCASSAQVAHPYRMSYTSLTAVDEIMCSVVSTFHASMTPDIKLFLNYFGAVFSPVAFFIIVEACRQGVPKALSSSLLFGIAYCTASGGVVISVYWLMFILTQQFQAPTKLNQVVSKGRAEAATFGFVIGAVVPTVCMLVLEDAYVTFLGQFFPIWISIAQFTYGLLRLPSGSGYPILRAAYIGIFVLCSLFHIANVWPLYNDWEKFHAIFIPSTQALVASTYSAAVLHLLQYDVIFVTISSMFGTLWFASNVRQVIGMICWYAVANVAIGPGGALAAVMLWRESSMPSTPESIVQAKGAKKVN